MVTRAIVPFSLVDIDTCAAQGTDQLVMLGWQLPIVKRRVPFNSCARKGVDRDEFVVRRCP